MNGLYLQRNSLMNDWTWISLTRTSSDLKGEKASVTAGVVVEAQKKTRKKLSAGEDTGGFTGPLVAQGVQMPTAPAVHLHSQG